jgi:hypothetical protein
VPRWEGAGDASRPARTRVVRDGHCGHAAGAVHTVLEHHASQHADHHSQPRKIATRSARTASPPPHADHGKTTHPIVVDLIHRFAAPLTSAPLGQSRRTTRAYRHLVQVPPGLEPPQLTSYALPVRSRASHQFVPCRPRTDLALTSCTCTPVTSANLCADRRRGWLPPVAGPSRVSDCPTAVARPFRVHRPVSECSMARSGVSGQ